MKLDRVYCQYPCADLAGVRFCRGCGRIQKGVANGLPVRHKLKNLVTLPELFRKNGYYSAAGGEDLPFGDSKSGGDTRAGRSAVVGLWV